MKDGKSDNTLEWYDRNASSLASNEVNGKYERQTTLLASKESNVACKMITKKEGRAKRKVQKQAI